MDNMMINLQNCIIKEKEPELATIKFNNIKPANTKHQLVSLMNITVAHESNN